jgi:hydroxypyruvate isomerase
MERRKFLGVGLAAGGTLLSGAAGEALGADAVSNQSTRVDQSSDRRSVFEGAVKQSVCRWCYQSMTVEQLAAGAKRIGLRSVELLEPEEWPAVKAAGLTCAMVNAPGDPKIRLTSGFNHVENHARLVPAYLERIAWVKDAGLPNLICFSGSRAGLTDEEGLSNCAKGLAAILPAAERAGVTICMELLNSKVDHHDYQCDHTTWGVALVKRVASSRFKLLYDIYHMQIMEGDVIRTIRDNHEHIAHFHTGGVPGRHEIDDAQELHYPAVMRAIRDTGFTGFVAQEFIPTREPLVSLAEAAKICTV